MALPTNSVEINIGLNVNGIESPYQLDNVLLHIPHYFTVRGIRIDEGKYKEEKERTVVLSVVCKGNLDAVKKQLEDTAKHLEQECIAFKYEGTGYIAFNPEFKGEKVEFNNEYFINY